MHEGKNKFLIEDIKLILNSQTYGKVSASVYDTAAVAMIPSVEDPSKPMFTKCLDWILKNQKSDGSWSQSVPTYYHDSIISALSGVLVLKKWNMGNENILKGINYINRNFKFLSYEKYSTVGFEIIFPKLLEEASKMGLVLNLEQNLVSEIIKKRNLKFSKIPYKILYSKPTTLLHSLEALNSDLDFTKLLNLQSPNGSFLNSPASTVFVYLHTNNKKSLDYIKNLVKIYKDHVPVNYPLDIFESLWMLNDIYDYKLESFFKKEIDLKIKYFINYLDENGISWSRYVNLPDLDDTSILFKIFKLNNIKIDEKIFQNFTDGIKFYCYYGEVQSGSSHIASLLDALRFADPNSKFVKSSVKKCFAILMSSLEKDGLWIDKWNISKFYVNCKLIPLFIYYNQEKLLARALKGVNSHLSGMNSLYSEEVFYLKRC